MKKTKCQYCNKEFKKGYDKRRGYKYCSLECYYQYKREEVKEPNCKCNYCKKEFYLKTSSIKQGMGKYCSVKCYHTALRKRAIESGETYNERHLIRQSSQYRTWRRKALEEHDNKCESCGVTKGKICGCCGHKIKMHVHHVKPFSSYPEYRFDPKNSKVLCEKCHKALENNGFNSVDS